MALSLAVVATVLAAAGRTPADANEEQASALRAELAVLAGNGELRVGSAWIASARILPLMYEHADFRLLWTDAATLNQLLVAVDGCFEDGLDPEDYHLSELLRVRDELGSGAVLSLRHRARADLLFSDALVRLELHLRFGKVDPASVDASWDFLSDRAGIARQDEAVLLVRAVGAGRVDELVAAARPPGKAYEAMRAELAKLRAIAAAGGWPQVPSGPTLRGGDEGSRVAALRARLAASGDLPDSATPAPPAHYDDSLAEGVRSFQRRHNLAADGIAGAKTLEALARLPSFWIDQLRVNMERSRWVRSRFQNGVIVDVAGFDARFLRDGEVLWRSRVTVGAPYRSTPVLRAKIRSLVLNPTWTVPPTILAEDVLPSARKDPEYLGRRGIQVLGSEGEVVDPNGVDWAAVAPSGAPYTFRQGPGPENPLGKIKFLFPNPHLVYLHDTPSRSQFHRAERAASSGCIRVERPLDLAELLVAGMPGWTRERIEREIATGRTKTVLLAKPVPVYLLYATAELGADGKLRFNNDIYGRDRAVLVALDRAYRDAEASLMPARTP